MNEASGSPQVYLEIHVDAAPETVFALLTEPTLMETWIADSVLADTRPGGRFRAEGILGTVEGTYLEVIPYTKVVFSWGGVEGLVPGQSTVEFTLEPKANGTLLRLRHYGLPQSVVEKHRQVWIHSGLPKIKDAAEGRKPGATCLSDTGAHAAVG
jgi:uncharacterized protein YndB with AHSA1/START domain